MKCPFCKGIRVGKSKVDGFMFCSICGAIIYDKIADDPELKNYKYKVESFSCRNPEVPEIFKKAKAKYENEKYEIIAAVMNRSEEPSLIFGQKYFAVKRKKK